MNTMPDRTTRISRIYLLGALLVIGAVLYTIFWFVSADRVRGQVDRWIERQRDKGVEITYADLEMGGFPYRYEVHMSDAVIGGISHPNDWQWRADKLTAVSLVYRPRHIIVELTGNQRFDYIEALGPEARAPRVFQVAATGESLRASLVFEGDRLDRLAVDLGGIVAERSGDGVQAQTMTADRLQFHTRSAPPADAANGGRDIYLQADNLVVPAGIFDVSEERIDRAEARIVLNGLQTDIFDGEALGPWAESGGVLDLKTFLAQGDGMSVTATGSLRLDNQDRPSGTFQTKVGNHGRIVDRLVAAGTLDRSTAATVKTVLTALALAGGDPDGRLTVPIIIKDGAIYVGPAKVGRVGPVF